ncbi:unnamed protein product [Vitrella brassicaformis CCMP3155]|uniref:Nudix hydrolase domain-containing protein n=1 Tax=Vitrella brassicaformis (strain CCMP3155) TaxID=1169540 RepID=A0A0G4H3V0_VITBC|nr:unnamed protein product [Vitrella brassicaformis CCMP3155]|eukprot:CEM38352.1 unnamed protein product [Vitrella brassicaformis CCMP3155]
MAKEPTSRVKAQGRPENAPNSDPNSAHFFTTDVREPFKVIGEQMVYQGWKNVMHRTIELPNGKTTRYDINHSDCPAVFVVPWDTQKKTTIFAEEYYPGPNQWKKGFVAGLYERKKHESPLHAAKLELEEEAHLVGGKWINLINERGVMDYEKYSDQIFYAFLCLDPVHTDDPRPLDDSEVIYLHRDVPAKAVLEGALHGHFTVTTSLAALLAIEKLREIGELPKDFSLALGA